MGEKKPGAVKPKITSLRLDPALHEAARIYGIRNGTTLQAIINQALADYLQKKKRGQ